ncbi:N-alpha-acetyltransferase 30 [Coemansia spiralis]|nr:N-alpha-acetyltransferase 30 [Coemansia spiralis]
MDLSKLTALTPPTITFKTYATENDLLPAIKLIECDLSEPYSIYTYRYFVHQWPELCILAHIKDECVGVIICKLDEHRRGYQDGYFSGNKAHLLRGYIGMVAVSKQYRKLGIGSALVARALKKMKQRGVDEVALEAETGNLGALKLYEGLGFIREKRLHRYYLGGTDAFRLKLWL